MATQAQCTACGENNPADSAFCLACGSYLGWDTAPPRSDADAGVPGPANTGAGAAPESASGPVPPAAPRAAPQSEPPTGPPSAPAAGPPSGSPPARVGSPTGRASEGDGFACPACGRPVEPGRRFCGRCGEPLVAAAPVLPRPADPATSPSARGSGGAQARAARRAYRRSLPAWYRWRRVVIAVLVAAAAVAAAALVAGGDPLRPVRDAWRQRTVDLVDLPGAVIATPEPAGSVAPTYAARSVVDGDPVTAWATVWPDGTRAGDGCGGAPGIGSLVLTWETPVRLEAVVIRAGLSPQVPSQDNVAQPSRIDLVVGDACVEVSLDREDGAQRRWLDLEEEVSSVAVRIAEVYPPRATPEDLVAVSEIRLRTARD